MKPAFRPRVVPNKMVSWRTTEQLYAKLLKISAIESYHTEIESGSPVRLSVNEVLNQAATWFVEEYEKEFGELPKNGDPEALKKYLKTSR